MSEMPSGWGLATLGELASPDRRSITDGPFGSNLTSAHYTATGPRVIRLQNIGNGPFIDNAAHISQDHFESLRTHEAVAGDLIVASLGQDLPRACLVPTWLGPAIVKADCIRVRLGDHVDPRWAVYAMQTPNARQWAAEQLHGVGRPRLGLKAIRAIPVPLPQLEDQRRIVDILEDHLSRLDAAGGYLGAAIRRASRLRESLLAQAKNAAARAHPSLPVGELVEQGRKVAYGVLVPGPHVDDGVPLVRVGDIQDGRVDTASLKRIAPEISARFPRTVLSGGEVLLSVVGTIGRVGVAPATLAGSNVARAVAVLPFDTRVNANYAALMLQAPATTRSLNEQAHEVARKTLNLEDVRRVRIPVPDGQTQTRLAAELSEKLERTRRVASDARREVLRAAELRRALLHAAFSGRLTSQTSDDDLEGLVVAT